MWTTLRLFLQYAPSGGAAYCHLLRELGVFLAVESLREGVCDLFSRWYVLQFDYFLLDLATQEMALDVDMFCAIVVLRILGDGHCGLATHANCGRVVIRESDFGEESPKPNDLFCSMGTSNVFSFSAGLRDRLLFLRAPRDRASG